MPPGFSIHKTSLTLMSVSDTPVEHTVITDGLARISIFIATPRTGVDTSFAQGSFYQGSLNTYMCGFNSQQITVLGEVPQSAVEVIGTSIEFFRK